ncbi:MAG: methionyl-tRNA formyltransferase [Clostridia bacterium]|nr:methionyl-tRNA formyltransferase [Clostridia bacterium]
MRILFMGTPDFAASVLDRISEYPDDTIVGVLTQPDKPRGRGYELAQSAVKKLALEKNIPVYQPETLRDNAFLPELNALDPELIIVAAYGKILPLYVLDYPKYGCINVHGSLLPKYRGAAPIQRSIIDGETVTGITIMKMAKGLDTGDMMLKRTVEITENDNFETLHDKMALCARDAVSEAIKLIREGKDVYEAQDDSLATYAEKITKDDCFIDFDTDAKSVHNRIRGLSPIPLAYSYLDSKMIKFTSSVIVSTDGENAPESIGKITAAVGDLITVACRKGSIGITGVLPEGKKRMSAADFIRGQQDLAGKKLTAK